MKQIVTGVQTTGSPHLGNIIGAIIPAIEMGRESLMPPVYIVADMHSMLSVTDPKLRRQNIRLVTSAWIAFGADRNGLLYRQSHVPELSEMAMLLSGSASMEAAMEGSLKPRVFENIHPMLMTADLLMLGTTHIPVGQDSRAHIDIVRDTAIRFNATYGNVLVVPDGLIDEGRPTVPGTDGRKMSKSFDNCIDVLVDPDGIRAAIEKIPAASGDTSSDKGTSNDIVFRLFQAVCTEKEFPEVVEWLRHNNATPSGARNRLTDLLVERFRPQRNEFDRLMTDPSHLLSTLASGEDRVREMATVTLERMKVAMGMS